MTARYQHPRKICLSPGDFHEGMLWATQPPEGAVPVLWYRIVARDAPPVDGTIWLQPWCAECERDSDEPRLWCGDDVWGCCEWWKRGGGDCHCKSIRYDPIEEEA